MRFLFTTLQFVESDFYGRVSDRLSERGHESFHVTFSRRAKAGLSRRGYRAWCLADLIKELGSGAGAETEAARIEAQYPVSSLREIYLADAACDGRAERWSLDWTVRHFLALERVFDEVRPDVVVPEVGTETMRSAAHLVGVDRGATVLFLFYTIFPRPLRLYADTYHAAIVPPEELRELGPEEHEEVETFIREFTRRGRPILPHRASRITRSRLRDFARHIAVKAVHERDNEYLHPSRFVRDYVSQRARKALSTVLYSELDSTRPFAYFPLHVTNDFKVKRVIPHCVDQEYLIRQVADALPRGHDLVLKEHPVSIGRNPVSMLRRLNRLPNVQLVDPYTSSHELIQRSRGVVVISSTVGLEALLYGKPVLTLGQPFYSGYGVTLDVDSFREIREAVPDLLRFEPDRERVLRLLHAAMRSTYRGAPAGVDSSDENAAALGASLDEAARQRRLATASVAV